MTPRQLLYHGTVPASAYLFPDDGPDGATRRRILSLWQPGARLLQASDGSLVLQLPAPETVRAQTAPGLPLVRVEGHLASVPLSPRAWQGLRLHEPALVRALGGSVVTEPLASLESVAIADWLDLGELAVHPTRPLRPPVPAPPDPIVLALPTPPPPALIARDASLEASRAAVVRALSEDRDMPGPESGLAAGATAVPSLATTLARWGRALLDGLGVGGSGAAAAFPPDQWEQLSRQNAAYIEKMLDLFERGDWTRALQHAIPLGKAGETPPTDTGPGVLTPRDELVIRPQARRASGSLSGDGFYSGFQKLYREAVERLKDAGRFQEAAYVLAELLRDDAEAVSFLERHNQLQLAAEMAEARNLPPGLVVRQWWLAGDRERALRIARRKGCFDEAIFRLERSDQRLSAETLRLEWAQILVDQGDYARAVTVVTPVESARPLARRWAELGVACGGIAGARLLAQVLLWSETPEEQATWLERAGPLLAEAGPEAARRREALLTPLFSEGRRRPDLLPVLRPGLRALLADQGAGHLPLRAASVSLWAKSAQLPALDADLPPLNVQTLPSLTTRTTPWEMRIEGEDVGTHAVTHAVLLPSGRVLAALGESGVVLLRHDGSPVARFDVPATALAASQNGELAVALAPRDASQRVHVLHLTTHRTTDWGELPLRCWESAFNDGLWYVSRSGQLLGMDLLASTPTALLQESVAEQIIGLSGDQGVLGYRHDDQTLSLRAREGPSQPILIPFPAADALVLGHTRHSLFWAMVEEEVGVVLRASSGGSVASSILSDPEDSPVGIAGTAAEPGQILFTAVQDLLGITVFGSPYHSHALQPPVLVVRLAGSRSIHLRATAGEVTLCDDQGRVLVVSTHDGTVRRNLRVRL